VSNDTQVKQEDRAREIVKKISDTALELAFTRHDLESDEFDETNYPDVGGMRQREQAFEKFIEEIKEDTLNCLTGDDTGCLDSEELDESNCELLWLESLLATVRREAFKEAQGMMDTAQTGTMASAEFHKGFEAMRRLAKQILERAAKLEASANQKGEVNE
jgi:hypothetical protein